MKKIFTLVAIVAIAGVPQFASGDGDPSSIPARGADGRYTERYRFWADFDDDGVLDLALSVPLGMFGQAGGNFSIYLARSDGTYHTFGAVFLNPRAISIESVGEKLNLWTYSRSSGSEGQLGYFVFSTKNDVNPSVSDFVGVTVYPGDGGTELGRELYSTVFADKYRVQVERSSTATGTPRWSSWPPKRAVNSDR